MLLMNFSALEKFGTMLGPPEFKQWNIENKYVDTVYNLKFIK